MAKQSQRSVGNGDTKPLPKRKRYDKKKKGVINDDDKKEKGVINPNSYSYTACLKDLHPKDAALVSDFLSSHPEARLREGAVSSDAEVIIAYTRLAELLRLVNDHTIIDILDHWRDQILELLRDLRSFSFDGPWLDSAEREFDRKRRVDREYLEELNRSVQSLGKDVQTLESLVDKHERDRKFAEAQFVQVTEQKEAVLKFRARISGRQKF